jgi:hypothetical protein
MDGFALSFQAVLEKVKNEISYEELKAPQITSEIF